MLWNHEIIDPILCLSLCATKMLYIQVFSCCVCLKNWLIYIWVWVSQTSYVGHNSNNRSSSRSLVVEVAVAQVVERCHSVWAGQVQIQGRTCDCFQFKIAFDLFSLDVGHFLITCNRAVQTLPSSFLFPIIIHHCKRKNNLKEAGKGPYFKTSRSLALCLPNLRLVSIVFQVLIPIDSFSIWFLTDLQLMLRRNPSPLLLGLVRKKN